MSFRSFNHNAELLNRCRVLSDYAQFVLKIRELNKTQGIEEAVEHAVDYCIQNKILHEFLAKHRREVKDMCLTEFNEERYAEIMKDEGRAEGMAAGMAAGMASGRTEGIITTCERFHRSPEEILEVMADELHITWEEAQRLYEEYKAKECSLV